MLPGCGNSSTTANISIKAEKLALTKENVQKVFQNQYNVEVDSIDSGTLQATFVTKKSENIKNTAILIKNIQYGIITFSGY